MGIMVAPACARVWLGASKRARRSDGDQRDADDWKPLASSVHAQTSRHIECCAELGRWNRL